MARERRGEPPRKRLAAVYKLDDLPNAPDAQETGADGSAQSADHGDVRLQVGHINDAFSHSGHGGHKEKEKSEEQILKFTHDAPQKRKRVDKRKKTNNRANIL